MGQHHGTIRAEISGHGQYETSAAALDSLIDENWHRSRAALVAEVKDRQGDPEYDTYGLGKIELILIIAELDGLATN